MIGSNIPVENMSHLTSSFLTRNDGAKYDELDIHPTQMTKKRIKLTLLFVVPGETDEDNMNEEDQRPDSLPRIASVRVPKGVPVAKLRGLIRHIEEQLQDIYGRSKRLNFIMQCNEESENWEYSFDLPTFGVVYV